MKLHDLKSLIEQEILLYGDIPVELQGHDATLNENIFVVTEEVQDEDGVLRWRCRLRSWPY